MLNTPGLVSWPGIPLDTFELMTSAVPLKTSIIWRSSETLSMRGSPWARAVELCHLISRGAACTLTDAKTIFELGGNAVSTSPLFAENGKSSTTGGCRASPKTDAEGASRRTEGISDTNLTKGAGNG